VRPPEKIEELSAWFAGRIGVSEVNQPALRRARSIWSNNDSNVI